jgi:hypothetical protein
MMFKAAVLVVLGVIAYALAYRNLPCRFQFWDKTPPSSRSSLTSVPRLTHQHAYKPKPPSPEGR